MAAHILQVELVHGDEGFQRVIDSFQVFYDEGAAVKDDAMAEILQHAAQAAPAGVLPRLTYQDDEGDWCTLGANTLSDALHFAKPLDLEGQICTLQVRIEGPLCSQANNELSNAPKRAAACKDWEANALQELDRLAQDVDLQRLVPRLAGAALRIIHEVQSPMLFPILDDLSALHDGQLTADSVPRVLSDIIAAVEQMPQEEAEAVVKKFSTEASKEAAKLKEDEIARGSTEVEVHPNIQCDECGQHPILGRCYKSLERDQYDLCKTCFDSSVRDPSAWVRVQSRGVLLRAAAASPTGAEPGEQAETEQHRGVQCDGCGMLPIVGRRFRSVDPEEDFDLCAACCERARAEEAPRHDEEVPTISASGSSVQAFEAPAAHDKEELHQEQSCGQELPGDCTQESATLEVARVTLNTMGATALKAALAALVRHPALAVREAAAAAVEEVLANAERQTKVTAELNLAAQPLQASSGSKPATVPPAPAAEALLAACSEPPAPAESAPMHGDASTTEEAAPAPASFEAPCGAQAVLEPASQPMRGNPSKAPAIEPQMPPPETLPAVAPEPIEEEGEAPAEEAPRPSSGEAARAAQAAPEPTPRPAHGSPSTKPAAKPQMPPAAALHVIAREAPVEEAPARADLGAAAEPVSARTGAEAPTETLEDPESVPRSAAGDPASEPAAAPPEPPTESLPAAAAEWRGESAERAPVQADLDMAAEATLAASLEEPAESAPAPKELGQPARNAHFVPPPRTPSALVVSSAPLMLGVEAQEDTDARKDSTEDSGELLSAVGLHRAYCVGRAIVPTYITGTVPALAKVIVKNDGQEPWPESTALTCVLGDAMDLPSLPLGAVQPGEAAEIEMDLLLPPAEALGLARSAWALVGSPPGNYWGPLLLFETLRVKE